MQISLYSLEQPRKNSLFPSASRVWLFLRLHRTRAPHAIHTLSRLEAHRWLQRIADQSPFVTCRLDSMVTSRQCDRPKRKSQMRSVAKSSWGVLYEIDANSFRVDTAKTPQGTKRRHVAHASSYGNSLEQTSFASWWDPCNSGHATPWSTLVDPQHGGQAGRPRSMSPLRYCTEASLCARLPGTRLRLKRLGNTRAARPTCGRLPPTQPADACGSESSVLAVIRYQYPDVVLGPGVPLKLSRICAFLAGVWAPGHVSSLGRRSPGPHRRSRPRPGPCNIEVTCLRMLSESATCLLLIEHSGQPPKNCIAAIGMEDVF